MPWTTIILWLIANLGPKLLAWILALLNRTRALVPIADSALRAEFTAIIQSDEPRRVKRKRAKALVLREARAEAEAQLRDAADELARELVH